MKPNTPTLGVKVTASRRVCVTERGLALASRGSAYKPRRSDHERGQGD
jgi:hypothetical protein